MAEFCAIYPKVGEEDSALYKELYKKTGKNRPLSNLLYALLFLPELRLDLAPSDYNSQGEVKTSVVWDKLNVDEIIDSLVAIANAEQELDAIDGNDYKEYDTVAEILPRVLLFNNREKGKVVATISSRNHKYIILIAPLDDTNYAKNKLYEAGLLQLQYILNKLSELGLNTLDLSIDSQRSINELNASFADELIRKYQSIYAFKAMSDTNIALLLDLFRDDNNVLRFVLNLDDKIYDGIRYLLAKTSGLDIEVPDELQDYKDYLEREDTLNKFRTFKRKVKSTFDRVSVNNVTQELRLIYKGLLTESDKLLKNTLSDLYEKWHLDLDSILSISTLLNSLEDITIAMISKAKNSLKILLARGAISNEDLDTKLSQIENIEKQLKQHEYAESIISYLQETVDSLDSIRDLGISSLLEGDLEQILREFNYQASYLLSVKELIDSRAPIIKALISLDEIEADELSDDAKARIKSIAQDLHIQIGQLDRLYRLKQFDLVYNFLKQYWGEDDLKQFGSFEIALKDALEKGSINMNLFDRGILAMTEVSDPVLATFGLTIKSIHEIRDALLRGIEYNIRVITENLYNSGSSSDFMFEEHKDSKGNLHIRLVSEIDWDAYYKARNEYLLSLKEKGLSVNSIKNKMIAWDEANLSDYELNDIYRLDDNFEVILDSTSKTIIHNVPNKKYRKKLPSMSLAQEEYYKYMIALKYKLETLMLQHGVKTNLFMPILITKEIIEEGSDGLKRIKDNFVDMFKVAPDDTLFGSLETIADSEGNEIRTLPVFYTKELKDQKRLTRDFSRSMLAFASMATNHNVMANRVSILELTKEFLMERPIEQSKGDLTMVQTVQVLGKRIVSPITKKSKETMIGGWLEDIMDAKFYGKKQKTEGSLFGGTVPIQKATDLATRYTSVTGLTMNLPGAIANALVGKILMIIEAGGSEFFNFKELAGAEKDYWALLPELLAELYSNNKSSKLDLLMDRFDALDEFYLRLKESGFYNSPISKILGNTNLFFMYGMGEHLLHALGMLACLKHTKVKKKGDSSGKKYDLLDALKVEKEGSNGKLVIDDTFETLDGREITELFLNRQRDAILYVNRSMHGAFGDDEKGAIHRYAIGRLIMNFRQWMPAHYARRFNKLHWDALLGDFREGYYVSTYKFVRDLLKDTKKHGFLILTRWKELDNTPEGRMQKANLRRTLTEVVLLAIFSMLSRLDFGKDPKNRSWAEALLRYLIMRINLEIGASSPANPKSFITNIYKMLNEPAAALALVNKLTTLFGIDDLVMMRTVQSGSHEGELVYFRNIERAIPFYDLVWKWWNMDTDDSMFTLYR